MIDILKDKKCLKNVVLIVSTGILLSWQARYMFKNKTLAELSESEN